jgi:hypothetical protein
MMRWCEHSMGGRFNDGKLVGEDTRAWSRGDLGEDDSDRWAPSASDGCTITGWQAGSRADMGRGRCKARPAAENMAHTDFFPFLNPFPIE